MAVFIFGINKLIIIDKVLVACVVRWVNVDNINSTLVCI